VLAVDGDRTDARVSAALRQVLARVGRKPIKTPGP
jgi:hypothetical protein